MTLEALQFQDTKEQFLMNYSYKSYMQLPFSMSIAVLFAIYCDRSKSIEFRSNRVFQ